MYESGQDRLNEKGVSERLTEAWGVEFHKMPISYYLDYLVTKNGDAVGVAEVKCRKCRHDQYPTLMLSLAKWNHGIDYVRKNGVSFLVVASYLDGLWRYLYDPEDDFSIKWGGRTAHTRDNADIEPVIHILASKMKKV